MSWKKYCDENYWHEAANVLPILEGDELNDLAEDIRKYGLQNPVVLLDGKVLDGRNRLLACKLADVEPSFQEWILRPLRHHQRSDHRSAPWLHSSAYPAYWR
jgi:hypothetical protein